MAEAGGLDNVEFVYIDIDRNRRLAAKLSKAETIPQLIRYYQTPEGWKYNLLNGAYKVPEVMAFINTGSIRPPHTARIPVRTTQKVPKQIKQTAAIMEK